MAGIVALLRWQWRAYWRRTLRGGTAARSNLVVLGLLSLAGFARYITLLRDAAKQTAKGDTALLSLLLAALLLLCLLPVWDASQLALAPREMVRFPLTAWTRFALRVLSRFIAPVSWILTLASIAGIWPVLQLRHHAEAAAAYATLMFAAFATGIALADLAATAKGARIVQFAWAIIAASVAIAWFSGVRTLPPLPSQLVLLVGAGHWAALLITALLAVAAWFAAFRTLQWMLRHAPPEQSPNRHRSASPMTLFRRELRLYARLVEVRTAWAIAAALCFYLATADHPEPDALRVMLGVLAFLTTAAAMNNFGLDGAAGLDRFLLWPVQGAHILAEKNRVFALLVIGPAVPLAALAVWRFGWREGAANLLEAAAIILAVLAWGNITSVRHPESAANASGGYLLDQLAGMAAIAIPTAAAIVALRSSGNSAWLYVLACTAVCGFAYAASLRWSARYFAANHERMRESLT